MGSFSNIQAAIQEPDITCFSIGYLRSELEIYFEMYSGLSEIVSLINYIGTKCIPPTQTGGYITSIYTLENLSSASNIICVTMILTKHSAFLITSIFLCNHDNCYTVLYYHTTDSYFSISVWALCDLFTNLLFCKHV